MHRLMSGDSGPSDNVVDMKRLFKLLPETKQRPTGDTNAKVALVSTNLVSWIVGTWSGDLDII